MPSESIEIKVVVIGESKIGKSALINRVKGNLFNAKQKPTVGVDFPGKLTIPLADSNTIIKCDIWDISGRELISESFEKFMPFFCTNAQIYYICADLSSENPGVNLQKVYNQIKDIIEDKTPNAKVVLMGTKLDLVNDQKKRQQSYEAFKKIQEEINGEKPGRCIEVILTSAEKDVVFTNTNTNTNTEEKLNSAFSQTVVNAVSESDVTNSDTVVNVVTESDVTNSNNTDCVNILAEKLSTPANYVIPHVTKKLTLNDKEAESDLKKIAKEIERTKFYPRASNKNNLIDDTPIKKHVTRTTKRVYDSIQKTLKKDIPAAALDSEEASQSHLDKLKDVEKEFIHANETKWSFFRSTATTTFYRAFASSHDALLAKAAFEEIFAPRNSNLFIASQNIGSLGGNSLYNRISKLYNIARNYNGLTWQEALCKVEELLAKEILNNPDPAGSLYRPAFEVIQEKYHSAMSSTIKELIARVEVDPNDSELFASLKDENGKDFSAKPSNGTKQCEKGTNEIYEKATHKINEIRNEMGSYSREDINKKLQALQRLSYNLFEIAQEIPFGRRNGSPLYNAIMRRISLCLGLNTDNLSTSQIRKTVENEIREHKVCYQARVKLFESKPLLAASIPTQQPSTFKNI